MKNIKSKQGRLLLTRNTSKMLWWLHRHTHKHTSQGNDWGGVEGWGENADNCN